MDLKSLRSGKSYFNPFTALIGLETSAADRRLSLSVPVIEDGLIARYSVLFHELTHLWSMRTTLLGAVLSAEASKAWTRWIKQADADVDLPDRVFELLGAWLPILEGLAMFAELDFEGNEDCDHIHSPILKVIHYTAPATNGVSNVRQFKLVRFSRVFEDHVLSNLLFDTAYHPTELAYLGGYLYVKALACIFSARCSRLSRPSRMLPLLIKILCDHSGFVKWRGGAMTPNELLDAIHRFALSLDVELLNKIADWVDESDPVEIVGRFDFLDLEASRHGSGLKFREATDSWYVGLTEEEIVMLRRLRASGSFYLVAWDSGTLTHVDETSIKLQTGSDKTEYVMLTSADFAKFNPSQINLELALGMRHHVIQNLQRSLGQQVTAAFYIDIASGDPGMAFWRNETLLIASPYSVSFLTKGDEYARQFAANLGIGLALSPNHRSSFGSSIKPSDKFLAAATTATQWHLARLVSSQQLVESIMRDKLKAIDNGRHVTDFDAWCSPKNPLAFDFVPATALAPYERAFDFPGFDRGNSLTFAKLLPSYKVSL